MIDLNDNNREFIDLHVHSNASDGTFTPEEVVEYAEEKGLYAIALTDHDTVDGIERAIEAAKGTPQRKIMVKVIPGIEISAEFEKSYDLHILGLNVDYKSNGFLRIVEECRKSRDNRNLKMIEKIRELGLPLTEEIMKERFKGASVTRAHFARYMMDEGFTESAKEAFEKYLNPGACCYVPREKISPENAIELILEAKGHPVLAHPMLYHMKEEKLDNTICWLKGLGLQGIEGLYSLNTMEDDRKLAVLAEKYGLFLTGGSDFHGGNKPDIDLGIGKGNLRMKKELLQNIL
ncbi:MAG: PHP domain-containing protein [Lachnospiraceae bacterium]|nr:PHP domain-containing protein [Lachnospiraceae bacterium]